MKKQFFNLGKALSKKEQHLINGGSEWLCHGTMCTRSNPTCSNGQKCIFHPTSEVMGCCGTLNELEFE